MRSGNLTRFSGTFLALLYALNLSVPLLFLFYPSLFGSHEISAIALSLHQTALSWGAATLLFCYRNNLPPFLKWMIPALIGVGMGDLTYGFMTWVAQMKVIGGYESLIHEIPYSVFALSAGASAVLRMMGGVQGLQRKVLISVCGLVAVTFFVFSAHFFIIPFYLDGKSHPWPFYIVCVTYALGQSAMLAGSILSSIRCRSILEFSFWFGVTFLISSDFVLRFRDMSGFTVQIGLFDIGWHISLVLIAMPILFFGLSGKIRSKFEVSTLADLISLRVFSATFSLVTLLLLMTSVFLVAASYGFKEAEMTSYQLTSAAMIWAFSNAVAIGTARLLDRRLSALNQKIINLDDFGQSKDSAGVAEELSDVVQSARLLMLRLKATNEEKNRLEVEAVKQRSISLMGAQVAHDIRSPLAAMAMAEQELSALPEETRLLVRSAINRINDIANQLSTLGREKLASHSVKSGPFLIFSALSTLVTEKRMELRERPGIALHLNLAPSAYRSFIDVPISDFNRVISNLINNAIEALGDQGTIEIALRNLDSLAAIDVIDNGKGIAPEILPQLAQRGFTYGKQGGSGLGLYHAKESCASWNGNIRIQSIENQETRVSLEIPVTPTPSWFVDRIQLTQGTMVVVLDDDQSIHQVWQNRLEPYFASLGVHYSRFSTGGALRNWVKSNPSNNAVFLIDYELAGEINNGLDLIDELQLQKCAILVTSHSDEREIQKRCETLSVRLMPKAIAGFVLIESLTRPRFKSYSELTI